MRVWQGGIAALPRLPLRGHSPLAQIGTRFRAGWRRMGQTERAVALDLLRSLALLGMAVFHFVFDLVIFGHLPVEAVREGFWPLWARVVASSFLFLSGFGLWLAYRGGIDWAKVGRRMLRIGGAALLVTVATRIGIGQGFVFWGILHMIAFGTLAGLAFLRLPAGVTLAVAGAVFWIGQTVALPAFDPFGLLWLGLGANPVYAVDYVPVFPWLAPVLAGVAAGRLATRFGLWDRISAIRAARGSVADVLAWPGRHSLAVYLVHQPLLIGLIWVATVTLG